MHKEGGAPVGRNRLGEMMTRLAAVLAEGGVEAARALCTPERPRNRQGQLANWAAMAAAASMEEEQDGVADASGGKRQKQK